MKTNIDIRLERDSRYAAAKAKLYELMGEVTTLERQRNDADAGVFNATETHTDRLRVEASAMLSGGPVFVPERDALTRTLNELTHRLAVLREAVNMQRGIVDRLRGEIGGQIALDLLPQHQANVKAVIEAALKLNRAVEAEAALRDSLIQADVPFSGIIRPMGINGFLLRDNQGRLFRYLLECEAEGFCDASDLPDVVRRQIVPRAKPVAVAKPTAAKNDGWLHAA